MKPFVSWLKLTYEDDILSNITVNSNRNVNSNTTANNNRTVNSSTNINSNTTLIGTVNNRTMQKGTTRNSYEKIGQRKKEL